MNNQPAITIVTSTYNCADNLKITANAIRKSSYKNIQWIIADGASNDKTLDVIQANQDIVSDWFSEKDSGIYDAWNKACKLIKGDWVIFLGAGDYFYASDTLHNAVRKLALLDESIYIAYGDVHLIDQGNNLLCVYGEVKAKWEFTRLALPPHQGTFHRANLFSNFPCFDTSYRIAADSKFLILALNNKTPYYLNLPISYMNSEGLSSSHNNTHVAIKEVSRLNAELNLKPPLLHLLRFKLQFGIKRIMLYLLPKRLFEKLVSIKRYLLGFR